jgi:hypothetical protein
VLRARLLGCSCNSGNTGSVSQFERQGTALENRQYTGVPFRFPRNTSRSFRVSNSMLGLWRTTPQDYPEWSGFGRQREREWVTGGNGPRDKSGEPTYAHLHHRQ